MSAETVRLYVVTAAQVVVRVPSAQGGEAYFWRGAILPPDAEQASLDHLVGVGLVKPYDVPVPQTTQTEEN